MAEASEPVTHDDRARTGIRKGDWRNTQWGELLSEFLGTFVLIAFGTGVVAMAVAGLPQSGRGDGTVSNGDWLLITFGWGMAVIMGIYVAGGISGAHLNPAVTIALAVRRGFAWSKVPGYIVAQVVGAFAGAALVFLNYKDAISAAEEAAGVGSKDASTVGIFVTGPAQYFDDYWGPLISEITGTALLIIIVFAVIDTMNIPPKANLGAIVIGFGVMAIGMSFGANSGYAINPARDFGPRLFTWMAGWGDSAIPGAQGNLSAYWWVPIVAPIIGAVIGAFVYDFLINDVLKARHKPADADLVQRGEVAEDELWMKKLLNDPADLVVNSLRGFAAAHGDLVRVNIDPNYVVRADAPVTGKVGILSGGGAGHEPMHAGFVGMGMLDVACPGEVFTSPTPDQMLAATTAVNGGAGVLHIVKNYTGDVLNFEMAADLARADGIEVSAVVINDDVAVQDSLFTAGRRGVGATVLAEKIVGAAAEEGKDLSTVTELCERVNAQSRSMGMALTSCTVPAAGKPTFELAEDEMEIGIGIHGEPGRERRKLASAKEVVEMLTIPIVEDLPFASGDNVLAFVNGMGGTPQIELYLVYQELATLLESRGVTIARSLVGSYITSLEMAGCSITLLTLDDELTRLWDAPVRTAGLRWGA